MSTTKNYEKKSRMYTEHIAVRVEPELKLKIKQLAIYKDVSDLLRDEIRQAVDRVYSEVFPEQPKEA